MNREAVRWYPRKLFARHYYYYQKADYIIITGIQEIICETVLLAESCFYTNNSGRRKWRQLD